MTARRESAAVFAYGSLVASESIAATLGRKPGEGTAPAERRLASLRGWRRRWSLLRDNRTCEKTFARDADGTVPAYVLSLNLERTGAPADAVNGLVIAVSGAELARLDRRELRYDRIDATRDIEPVAAAVGFGQVHVYSAKPANHAFQPPPDAIILSTYASAVRSAFASLGPEQLDLYLQSTGAPPLEPVDAHLVGDRIPAGNPRAW